MSPSYLEVTWPPEGRLTTRGMVISLDGKEVGTLPQGHTMRLEVEPGEHCLGVSNKLYRSAKTFSADAGKTVRFETGMRASGCFVPMIMLGAAALTVYLEQRDV